MVETRASKARKKLEADVNNRNITDMARAVRLPPKSRVLNKIGGSGVHSGDGERSTSGTSINSGPAPTNSRLLDLAPELRNRIYEYTPISESVIIYVNSDTNPPALLATCRQMRFEAQAMYYNQNQFRFMILDCDLTLLVRWLFSFLRYAKIGNFSLATSYHVQDPSTHGSNLMKSMKLAFDRRLALNLRDAQALLPDHVKLIDKVVDITNTGLRQGLAWENVEYRLGFYLLAPPPLVHGYKGLSRYAKDFLLH